LPKSCFFEPGNWQPFVSKFLNDPSSYEVLLRLLVLLVGGSIGAECGYGNKPSRFRTMILICLGFLFYPFSIIISGSVDRIAANIASYTGFIGVIVCSPIGSIAADQM
jgi:uncharacterized membrane protein YhiD involved in acid resistance